MGANGIGKGIVVGQKDILFDKGARFWGTQVPNSAWLETEKRQGREVKKDKKGVAAQMSGHKSHSALESGFVNRNS